MSSDFDKLVEFLDNDPTLIFKLPENLLVRVLNEVDDIKLNKYIQCMLDNPMKHTNETVKNIFLKYGYENSIMADLEKEPQQTSAPDMSMQKSKITPVQESTEKVKSTPDLKVVEKFYNSFLSIGEKLHETNFVSTLIKYVDYKMTWQVIALNEQIVAKLDDALVEKLYTSWSPYRVPLQNVENKRLLFCITNMRKRYLERLAMTSLVSYLYRCVREYDFYDLDYQKSKGNYPDLNLKEPKVLAESTTTERMIDGKKDTLFSNKRVCDISDEDMKSKNLLVRQLMLGFLNDHFQFDPDIHVMSAGINDVKVPDFDVPLDTFKRWQFYEDVNYEKLRDISEKVFGEKSDTEYCILPLTVVNDAIEEKRFIEKNEKSLRVNIQSVNIWAWTFLDSRKENRDQIVLPEKKTELLKKWVERYKEEEKLSEDMLKKRVRTQKKKQEEKYGPLDPKIYKYGGGGELSQYGIQPVDDINLKTTQLEDKNEECPDSAVEVGVFKFMTNPETKDTEVEVGKFFTESEEVESVNVMRGE